jgi:PTH1 family peptidyl-tRNA hydrolase
MQTVRVIAGLGNPGPAYDGTRHNIGFELVDHMAAAHGAQWRANERFCAHTASIVIAGKPVLLIKPQTFMNLSGRAISNVCRYYKWAPRNVLVAYDEYQLPVATAKLSVGGSDGGHNGIASIIQLLGADFPRLRIGIAPESKPLQSLTDFVLGKFTAAERSQLDAAWDRLLQHAQLVITKGPALAANFINQRIKTSQSNS